MYKIGLFTDTYTPQINGVVTVIRTMEKELARLGHQVYVFAPSHPEKYGDQNQPVHKDQKRESVFRFPSFKFIFQDEYRVAIPYNRRAFQILSTLDVVHSHTPFSMGLLALRVANKYDLPHIHTYHTFYAEYRHYIPKFLRPSRKIAEAFSSYFCNKCRLVIAPSNQIKRELENYGLQTPVQSLPSGVDMERFNSGHSLDRDPRGILGIDDQEDLLLYVGRLGREKNIDFLLRSFKHLLSFKNKVRLVIAGGGPEKNKLEKKAANQLGDRVIFTGYIEDDLLSGLYRQADLFVFASKTETQGVVIMEAFASKTPVVCIGEMGVLDLVEDGKTGLLVDEDEEKFALACLRLLENRDDLKLIGKKAKQKAYMMSSRRFARKLVKIYDYFCQEKKIIS